MTYKLTIVKIEDNSAYDAEKAKEAAEWSRRYTELPQHETRQLEIVLSEAEFEAIKHSVWETWK